TFSWPRLTRPRLASRQAAPWSRKISATSRAGRTITPALLRWLRFGGFRQGEPVERAHDGSQYVGGDVRIARGRLQFGMAEKHLDNTHIQTTLHQMCREGMTQRVRRDPRPEACRIGRGVAGAIELSIRDRQQWILTRKQPAPRPALHPPRAQDRE